MKENPGRVNGLCRVCSAPENALCADDCWLSQTIRMAVQFVDGGPRPNGEKVDDLGVQLERALNRASLAERTAADLAAHLRGCRPCL